MKSGEKIGTLWLVEEYGYPNELHVVTECARADIIDTLVLFCNGNVGWWRFSREFMSRISVRLA